MSEKIYVHYKEILLGALAICKSATRLNLLIRALYSLVATTVAFAASLASAAPPDCPVGDNRAALDFAEGTIRKDLEWYKTESTHPTPRWTRVVSQISLPGGEKVNGASAVRFKDSSGDFVSLGVKEVRSNHYGQTLVTLWDGHTLTGHQMQHLLDQRVLRLENKKILSPNRDWPDIGDTLVSVDKVGQDPFVVKKGDLLLTADGEHGRVTEIRIGQESEVGVEIETANGKIILDRHDLEASTIEVPGPDGRPRLQIGRNHPDSNANKTPNVSPFADAPWTKKAPAPTKATSLAPLHPPYSRLKPGELITVKLKIADPRTPTLHGTLVEIRRGKQNAWELLLRTKEGETIATPLSDIKKFLRHPPAEPASLAAPGAPVLERETALSSEAWSKIGGDLVDVDQFTQGSIVVKIGDLLKTADGKLGRVGRIKTGPKGEVGIELETTSGEVIIDKQALEASSIRTTDPDSKPRSMRGAQRADGQTTKGAQSAPQKKATSQPPLNPPYNTLSPNEPVTLSVRTNAPNTPELHGTVVRVDKSTRSLVVRTDGVELEIPIQDIKTIKRGGPAPNLDDEVTQVRPLPTPEAMAPDDKLPGMNPRRRTTSPADRADTDVDPPHDEAPNTPLPRARALLPEPQANWSVDKARRARQGEEKAGHIVANSADGPVQIKLGEVDEFFRSPIPNDADGLKDIADNLATQPKNNPVVVRYIVTTPQGPRPRIVRGQVRLTRSREGVEQLVVSTGTSERVVIDRQASHAKVYSPPDLVIHQARTAQFDKQRQLVLVTKLDGTKFVDYVWKSDDTYVYFARSGNRVPVTNITEIAIDTRPEHSIYLPDHYDALRKSRYWSTADEASRD